MPNPLNYVTKQDLKNLGLTDEDIANAYQPSKGGYFHIRGDEGTGKTLWAVHDIRDDIDNGYYQPSDGFGNINLKGKYSWGYRMLRGEELYQELLNLYEKPLRHKFAIIDEIDLEFPARFFSNKEQTKIALGMWQMKKFDNKIYATSHAGNSTDLIFHLASHYIILPEIPNFETQTLDFTLIDKLHRETSYWTALDVVKTMLLYNRQETTASFKNFTKNKKEKSPNQDKEIELDNLDLDFEDNNILSSNY